MKNSLYTFSLFFIISYSYSQPVPVGLNELDEKIEIDIPSDRSFIATTAIKKELCVKLSDKELEKFTTIASFVNIHMIQKSRREGSASVTFNYHNKTYHYLVRWVSDDNNNFVFLIN